MSLDCQSILIDLYIMEQVITSSRVGRIDSRVCFYELILHTVNLDCQSLLIDSYLNGSSLHIMEGIFGI